MIPLPSLTALAVADVLQNQAEIIERVQEENPTLDLRRGVFADLLAYYNALLATRMQAGIAAYWKSRSLLALNADPTADPALVDDLLSNYRVTRQPGSKATGQITVVVADDITVTIAQGAVWQAQGRNFVTTAVFTAKVEQAQINSLNDRLLTKMADGNWGFTIDVIAVDEGAGAVVVKDNLIVPVVLPPRYVTSFAASDFSSGRDPETNQDLLNRLQQGIAAQALSNRINMLATLRGQQAFARVVASSIIGFGDPEMQRDRHWIFPISGGGRCDWYVRTQAAAVRLRLTKTASLTGRNPDGSGLWSINLTRADAPGFYEVGAIRPVNAGNTLSGFTIESEVRGVDLSGPGFVPDIKPDSTEWAFTRFQTATITFTDTLTDSSALPLGSQQDYALDVVYLPQIAAIQDFLSSREVRPFGADCLVKAPIPCLVQLHLTVYKQAGDADPDLTALAAALCQAVNSIGFVGALYASQLQSTAQRLVAVGQSVSAIDMLGRIRYPDGHLTYLRSAELLQVPNDPANMVSSRTVQFFASPEDVAIAVVSALPSNP